MSSAQTDALRLDAEADRLRIEVSDLRRRLIVEQEQRAMLALEFHRRTRAGERPDAPAPQPSVDPGEGVEMDRLIPALDAAAREIEAEAARLQSALEECGSVLSRQAEQAERLRAELASRDALVRAMRASTSWRLTAPLRALKGGAAAPVFAEEASLPIPFSGDLANARVRSLASEIRSAVADLEAALRQSREIVSRDVEDLKLQLHVLTSDLHRAADLNDRLQTELQAERDRASMP